MAEVRYVIGADNKQAIAATEETANALKTLNAKTVAEIQKSKAEITAAYESIRKSGKLSADEIQQAWAAKNKRMEELDKELLGKQASIIDRVKSSWLGITAVVASVTMTISQAMHAMESGAQATQAEQSFRALAQSINADADQIVRDLKRVTGETIDDSDLMQKAVKGIMQDFDPAQVIKMGEMARLAARQSGETVGSAYERIVDAISVGNTRALKQMGLVSKEQIKLVDQALAAGVKDVDLFTLAVANYEKKLAMLGGITANSTESFQGMRAVLHDLKEDMGKNMLMAIQKLGEGWLWLQEIKTKTAIWIGQKTGLDISTELAALKEIDALRGKWTGAGGVEVKPTKSAAEADSNIKALMAHIEAQTKAAKAAQKGEEAIRKQADAMADWQARIEALNPDLDQSSKEVLDLWNAAEKLRAQFGDQDWIDTGLMQALEYIAAGKTKKTLEEEGKALNEWMAGLKETWQAASKNFEQYKEQLASLTESGVQKQLRDQDKDFSRFAETAATAYENNYITFGEWQQAIIQVAAETENRKADIVKEANREIVDSTEEAGNSIMGIFRDVTLSIGNMFGGLGIQIPAVFDKAFQLLSKGSVNIAGDLMKMFPGSQWAADFATGAYGQGGGGTMGWLGSNMMPMLGYAGMGYGAGKMAGGSGYGGGIGSAAGYGLTMASTAVWNTLAGGASAIGLGGSLGSVVPIIGTVIGAAIGMAVESFISKGDDNLVFDWKTQGSRDMYAKWGTGTHDEGSGWSVHNTKKGSATIWTDNAGRAEWAQGLVQLFEDTAATISDAMAGMGLQADFSQGFRREAEWDAGNATKEEMEAKVREWMTEWMAEGLGASSEAFKAWAKDGETLADTVLRIYAAFEKFPKVAQEIGAMILSIEGKDDVVYRHTQMMNNYAEQLGVIDKALAKTSDPSEQLALEEQRAQLIYQRYQEEKALILGIRDTINGMREQVQSLKYEIKQMEVQAFNFAKGLEGKIQGLRGGSGGVAAMVEGAAGPWMERYNASANAEERMMYINQGIGMVDEWLADKEAQIRGGYKEWTVTSPGNRDIIEPQIKILEKELEVQKGWEQLLEGIKQTISDLTLSDANPADVFERMDYARAEADRLKALVQGTSGEEQLAAAGKYREALLSLLNMGKEAGGVSADWQRPGFAYGNMFEYVMGEFQGLQGLAEGQSEAQKQTAIQEEIKSLNARIVESSSYTANNSAEIDRRLRAAREEAAGAYEWLQKEGVDAYAAAIAEKQGKISDLETDISTMTGYLWELTDGLGVDGWLATAQQAAIGELQGINRALASIYSGAFPNAEPLSVAGGPSGRSGQTFFGAGGAVFDRPTFFPAGSVFGEAGTEVLSPLPTIKAAVRDALSESRGGNTYYITLDARGSSDPDEFEARTEKVFMRLLKHDDDARVEIATIKGV